MAGSQKSILSAQNANSSMQASASDLELKEACQQFEAIFVKQMLSSMRSSVQKSGFINGGMSEKIFEDMLFDEYANKMSQSGQFGLGDQIYNQMKFLNEGRAVSAYSESMAVSPENDNPIEIIG